MNSTYNLSLRKNAICHHDENIFEAYRNSCDICVKFVSNLNYSGELLYTLLLRNSIAANCFGALIELFKHIL